MTIARALRTTLVFEFIVLSISKASLQHAGANNFCFHNAGRGQITDKNALALDARLQGNDRGSDSQILSDHD